MIGCVLRALFSLTFAIVRLAMRLSFQLGWLAGRLLVAAIGSIVRAASSFGRRSATAAHRPPVVTWSEQDHGRRGKSRRPAASLPPRPLRPRRRR